MMHLLSHEDHAAPPLTERDAERHLHGICFKTGPPGAFGVELEWLVCDGADPAEGKASRGKGSRKRLQRASRPGVPKTFGSRSR